MKTKICFLFGLVLAAVFSVKAQDANLSAYLQLYGTNFLNTMTNPIRSTAYMGTNLVLRLYGKEGVYTNRFMADDEIDGSVIPISPPSTNEVFYRKFKQEQSFDFHLYNEAGREVPKTQKGLDNSQPVHPPSSKNEALNLRQGSAPFGGYRVFRPDEMFVITNKGAYEMEIRLRIWAKVSDNGPNNDRIAHFIKVLGTNAHFDVVILQPVRVKVIKE